MRIQKETYLEKCVQLLELLNLTQDQLNDLEEYLIGKKGGEVLEQLPYKNLGVSPKSYPPALTCLVSYGNENLEQTGRMFNILFELGGTSCQHLIPNTNSPEVFQHLLTLPGIDPAKAAAVAAEQLSSKTHFFSGDTLHWFRKTLNDDPELIKRAYLVASYPLESKNVSYARMHSFGAGQIYLLTTYFLTKYPDGKGPLEEEDIPIMKYYEDTLTDNLDAIYEPHNNPTSAIQSIARAIKTDQITDRTLMLASKKCRISAYYLHLFGGAAFLNFGLSLVLRNFAKICFVVSLEKMFATAVLVSKNFWMDAEKRGGEYDVFFDIDPKDLILQAASKELANALRDQYHKNKDLFLQILDDANAHDSFAMMGVLKQEDERLFLERQKNGGGREREKIINLIADQNPVINEVKAYLRGETDLSSLYAYEDQIYNQRGHVGGIMQARQFLHPYVETYHDEAFYNRVAVHQLLRGCNAFFYMEISSSYLSIKRLFAAFDSEHVDMAHQVKCVLLMQYYFFAKNRETMATTLIEIFTGYLAKNREEVLSAFQNAEIEMRVFAIKILSKSPDENKEPLLSYVQDSSKAVREELLKVLAAQKSWEPEMITLLSAKKAVERETAIRTLARWDLDKYRPLLAKALEKEKNNKLRTLLQEFIDQDAVSAGNVLTLQELVKELHKGGKKRTLAWAYETPFCEVHKKDGSLAEEDYLQAILLSYSFMTTCGVSRDAAALAAELNEAEFALYVNELFDKWLSLGAEAKKRWVLYASAIHGGTDIIRRLQHQINEWPQHSRGAIASDAVQALALNPNPEALLIVDGISRKFKFRQVKDAAGKALKFAAEQLNITTEELADRIVPSLGFDEKMERLFDYGPRQFTVTLTTALEVEVFDENGKKLKSLPAPGKKDDPEKSAESYAAFKEMKKQMKTTIASQKMRLELALSTERQWSCDDWKKLFVENPVMHQFAIGLIWGIYEEKKLTQTFRYMEDGSFNTEEEEEFTLPEGKKIGLVHPVELSEESVLTWKTQLEDYEITQPIEQLSRPVYHMTEEEAQSQSVERFKGCAVNDLSLIGKMQTLGWYKSPAEDAGIFYSFYREDKEQDLKAELNFSGTYVAGENQDVEVYDVKFNKKIKEIPERYFSEIVMQAGKVTSSGQK